jgi:hypothetical protein
LAGFFLSVKMTDVSMKGKNQFLSFFNYNGNSIISLINSASPVYKTAFIIRGREYE